MGDNADDSKIVQIEKKKLFFLNYNIMSITWAWIACIGRKEIENLLTV